LKTAAADVDVAARALRAGMAPVPLSPWFVHAPQTRALLLGVTNVDARRLAADCRLLADVVRGL
jgi:GntR family transcriptional regulator/MocR family aminotransferase